MPLDVWGVLPSLALSSSFLPVSPSYLFPGLPDYCSASSPVTVGCKPAQLGGHPRWGRWGVSQLRPVMTAGMARALRALTGPAQVTLGNHTPRPLGAACAGRGGRGAVAGVAVLSQVLPHSQRQLR